MPKPIIIPVKVRKTIDQADEPKEDSRGELIKTAIIIAGIIVAALIVQYATTMSFAGRISFIALLFFIMVFIAQRLLDAGTRFCVKLKIPAFFLGLIILPFLSSLHEQMITILTSQKDSSLAESLLAQQLGNKLFELLITFGVIGSLLIMKKKQPIQISENEHAIVIRNGAVMIAGTVLLALLVLIDHNLSFNDGIALVVFYMIFISIVFLTNRGDDKEVNIEELPNVKTINAIKELLRLIIYLTAIIYLANIISDNIIVISYTSDYFLHYSFFFIGLLLALPNLIISLVGLYQNKTTTIIGLSIGSTIWELSISIAILAFVNPIAELSSLITIYFITVLVISAFISMFYIRTQWRLHLWETISLAGLYLAIIIVLFLYF
jgi:cation:H+ antiporter